MSRGGTHRRGSFVVGREETGPFGPRGKEFDALSSIEPRPLNRGWPLFEAPRRFELGSVFDCGPSDLPDFAVRQALGSHRSGWWECDLSNSRLTWTAGVYDIFGLPQGAAVSRDEVVALYCEDSRAAMESLRSYAIAEGKGFVLDAEIRPVKEQSRRWMRLIGAPVCEEERSVRLHGLKLWL